MVYVYDTYRNNKAFYVDHNFDKENKEMTLWMIRYLLCKFVSLFDLPSIMLCNKNFWKRSHCKQFEEALNEVLIFLHLLLWRSRKDLALMNGLIFSGKGLYKMIKEE
jgi:hypothetical protein